MRNRVPAFKPLGEWAIELLCEKALASSYQPMAPGCAFRRVLEAISSGVLMPGKFSLAGFETRYSKEYPEIV